MVNHKDRQFIGQRIRHHCWQHHGHSVSALLTGHHGENEPIPENLQDPDGVVFRRQLWAGFMLGGYGIGMKDGIPTWRNAICGHCCKNCVPLSMQLIGLTRIWLR